MNTKTCTVCAQAKPITDFHINRQQLSGRHPWCKGCKAAAAKRYYDANLEKVRKASGLRTMKHRYGLTADQYQTLLDSQGGVCAICGCPPKDSRGARLCVDHDHATSQVRGLLCTPCNLTLGYMNDNPQTLLAAVAYLRRWVQSQ